MDPPDDLGRLGEDVRRELRRFGPNIAISEVVDAWPTAVGPEIARNAWPARFQRDGTLVVHVKDAVWGFELTQRAQEISERLPAKPRLTFVPGPLPESDRDVPSRATPQGSPPTPAQLAQAAEWASAIDDPELRELVRKAAEASLAQGTNDRSF